MIFLSFVNLNWEKRKERKGEKEKGGEKRGKGQRTMDTIYNRGRGEWGGGEKKRRRKKKEGTGL